ncbi:hypothetical protein HMPREF9952_0322 [Haemophilus pittmaniae HK 85]|uniref:Uncharacterized protein n=1 Tax=Haemophilus pittmaniae HK 85 TaxID=1035188 RepID=F9QA30_9PAST|nr:hypothetical protein HMPREF9952_0322 [Haemophilus pittmaniae HK 85]
MALIFVVISLAYTIWSYYKMFGRIDESFIEEHKHTAY